MPEVRVCLLGIGGIKIVADAFIGQQPPIEKCHMEVLPNSKSILGVGDCPFALLCRKNKNMMGNKYFISQVPC